MYRSVHDEIANDFQKTNDNEATKQVTLGISKPNVVNLKKAHFGEKNSELTGENVDYFVK